MVTILLTNGLLAVEPTDDTKTSMNVWMKRKLEHSQKILEGLANADYDAIQSNAAAMRKLTKLEAFARRKDADDYRMQLRVFDFANAELVRLAEEKNLDGAASAFNQLTLSCLNCHKLLRDVE
jgi:hypothetical protein